MSALDRLKKRFWWLPVGHVPEINAAVLNARLSGDNPPKIVDVRSGVEWRRSHIPGAVSVPINELKDRLASLQLDAQQPIIAICLSAHRSIPAVRLLQAQGFENAVQLKGGMLAWWNQHIPPNERARDSGVLKANRAGVCAEYKNVDRRARPRRSPLRPELVWDGDKGLSLRHFQGCRVLTFRRRVFCLKSFIHSGHAMVKHCMHETAVT